MSHPAKHNSDEIRGELEGAIGVLSDCPEHVGLRVLLTVVWKLNENLVTVSKNQVENGHDADAILKGQKLMITSLDSIKTAVKLAETTITDQRTTIADLQAQNAAKDTQIATLTAQVAAGDALQQPDLDGLAVELTNTVTPPAV